MSWVIALWSTSRRRLRLVGLMAIPFVVVIELMTRVPDKYTFAKHAMFRVEKGALGFLHVQGAAAPEWYREEAVPAAAAASPASAHADGRRS